MKIYTTFLFLLIFTGGTAVQPDGYSQPRHESERGFTIKNSEKNDNPEEEELSPEFIFEKNISLLHEDTSAFGIFGTDVITNSGWVKVDQYYTVTNIENTKEEIINSSLYPEWNVNYIDPYNIDPANDTIHLELYNSAAGKNWALPLKKDHTITSKFGFRRYRNHCGTDLDLETGDTVCAVFDGVVRISGYNKRGYGNYIVIRHANGLETLYGHLSERTVESGDYVAAGESIGLGGNTGRSSGSHLHFEIRHLGNPLNPTAVFDFENQEITDQEFLLKPEYFSYSKSKSKNKGKTVYHKIRSGETLGRISRKYGIGIKQICRLNGISSKTTLRVGRSLRIK